jgi:hypothetical protein
MDCVQPALIHEDAIMSGRIRTVTRGVGQRVDC